MNTLQILRKSFRSLGLLLILIGLIGWFGQPAMSYGLFGPLHSVAWPVGDYTEAERLPDGRYAILAKVGRVQIYSSSLQFLYGWLALRGEGVGVLRLSSDGILHVYARARRSVHWKFDHSFTVDGTPLSISNFNFDGTTFPGQPPVTLKMPTDHTAWWTHPLAGRSFVYVVAGVALWFVTMSGEELAAMRIANQRGKERRAASRPLFLE